MHPARRHHCRLRTSSALLVRTLPRRKLDGSALPGNPLPLSVFQFARTARACILLAGGQFLRRALAACSLHTLALQALALTTLALQTLALDTLARMLRRPKGLTFARISTTKALAQRRGALGRRSRRNALA
jgi:hypothetical protein